jgi:hypothetical protein
MERKRSGTQARTHKGTSPCRAWRAGSRLGGPRGEALRCRCTARGGLTSHPPRPHPHGPVQSQKRGSSAVAGLRLSAARQGRYTPAPPSAFCASLPPLSLPTPAGGDGRRPRCSAEEGRAPAPRARSISAWPRPDPTPRSGPAYKHASFMWLALLLGRRLRPLAPPRTRPRGAPPWSPRGRRSSCSPQEPPPQPAVGRIPGAVAGSRAESSRLSAPVLSPPRLVPRLVGPLAGSG